MKKALLLGTTAVVAASLFAAPSAKAAEFDVSVGGYMDQYFGYGDNEDPVSIGFGGTYTDPQNVQQFSNVEIHFNAEMTTDGGLTFGAEVQLMGDNDETSSRAVDEHFAFVEGQFGRVELGATPSGAFKQTVIAPNVGMPINNGEVDQVMLGFGTASGGFEYDRTTLGGTFLDIGADDAGQKVTYFTPNFNGFRGSVSYMPELSGSSDNIIADKSGDYADGWAAGIGYNGSFNDVSVAASAGYYAASAPTGADDYKAWNAGLNVGAQMGDGTVTLGGSYASVFSLDEGLFGGFATTFSSEQYAEGSAFDLGISYDTGPWAVSLTYLDGSTDGAGIPGPDVSVDTRVISGAARYKLAEGAALTGTIGHADRDATGAAFENSGFFAAAGLHLNY
jgi:hypothetical protein